MLIKINPFLFLAEGDEGGGGGEEDPAEKKKGKESPNTEDPAPPESGAKTHTQADIDKVAIVIRGEGSKAGYAKALADLGFENVEDAKKILEAAEVARKEEQGELVTAQEERDKAIGERDAAKLEADERMATADLRLIRAEVLAEAAKPEHKINPDALSDVWGLVKDEQRDKLKVDDEGNVTGAEEAVKVAIENRDYLKVTKSNPGTPRPGQRRSPKSPDTKGTSIRNQRDGRQKSRL